jgi:hypothetical protein
MTRLTRTLRSSGGLPLAAQGPTPGTRTHAPPATQQGARTMTSANAGSHADAARNRVHVAASHLYDAECALHVAHQTHKSTRGSSPPMTSSMTLSPSTQWPSRNTVQPCDCNDGRECNRVSRSSHSGLPHQQTARPPNLGQERPADGRSRRPSRDTGPSRDAPLCRSSNAQSSSSARRASPRRTRPAAPIGPRRSRSSLDWWTRAVSTTGICAPSPRRLSS